MHGDGKRITEAESAERHRLMQAEELLEIYRGWKAGRGIAKPRLLTTQPDEKAMQELDRIEKERSRHVAR